MTAAVSHAQAEDKETKVIDEDGLFSLVAATAHLAGAAQLAEPEPAPAAMDVEPPQPAGTAAASAAGAAAGPSRPAGPSQPAAPLGGPKGADMCDCCMHPAMIASTAPRCRGFRWTRGSPKNWHLAAGGKSTVCEHTFLLAEMRLCKRGSAVKFCSRLVKHFSDVAKICRVTAVSIPWQRRLGYWLSFACQIGSTAASHRPTLQACGHRHQHSRGARAAATCGWRSINRGTRGSS